MKTGTAVALAVLGVAVVGGTVGTVVVVQRSGAAAKAREQERALELERIRLQAAQAAAKTPAAAPAVGGFNLGNIAKDIGGFLGDVGGLVGGFKDLLKF